MNTREICNAFAVNFKQNVEKILHKCDLNVINNTSRVLTNSFYLAETDEEEVYAIIRGLKTNKSPGVDGIRPIDIKNNANIFTPIVTNLINLIINTATVPDIFKVSCVRPIYKNGCKNDFNNYRPISILPVMEKIMEEILVKRLNIFIDKYKIISQHQYGFQKGKNINKLLGNFANYINEQLSKNNHCLTLFIDFSKAFDTLSHAKLLSTLGNIGIRGNCLTLFENYLKFRKFFVKVSGSLSQETTMEYGVPQGSKLGPILFIIYTNELINFLNSSKTYAYADDTTVVVAHKNLDTALKIMQIQLEKTQRWCHDHGLIINASKTKLMHIKPPHFRYVDLKLKFHCLECLHDVNRNSANCDLAQCNTTVEIVNSYKYLGVIVDQNFKWHDHIEYLRKKLRKASYMLYHLRCSSNEAVLRQAYFALVESNIRHGITAWGSSSHCRKLQQTQNHLIKILDTTKHFRNHQTANVTPENSNDIYSSINFTYEDTTTINENHSLVPNSSIHVPLNNNNSITSRNNNSTRHIMHANTTNNIDINSTGYNTYANNNNSNTNIHGNNIICNNNIIETSHINNTNNILINTNSNSNNHASIYNNANNNNTYRNNTTREFKDIKILDIKNIYNTTLAIEFGNDSRFLKKIDHKYQTRRNHDGRFKIPKFKNSYGKNTLAVVLPSLYNKMPSEIINISSNCTKKRKMIREFFMNAK